MAADLSRLLNPRSIAVFGGRQAAEIVRQCLKMGFPGEVWPVHPRAEAVLGRPAYRSAADLPGVPDACFLGINRHLTVELMPDLARMGAGGAVVFSSGYAEAGEASLQARLIEAAGAMPFLGPNCYGFINYLDGALLWPDQHGGLRVERGVALITQSGNIGLNMTMARRALPIGYLVTLGNQAAVGLADVIRTVAADRRVSAIGLHIEGIDDPEAFAAAAEFAREQGVPLVAIKTGRSAAGARLTVSHTASMAGSDRVSEAFLEAAGVVRVPSIPVLLETLKVLHVLGPLSGRAVASMSCSGGEAALIADLADRSPLDFRPLGPAQAEAVAATLSELVTVSNPLDYHTFSWANAPALTETFAAMMEAGYDLTLLVLDFPRADRCDDADWMQSVVALAAAARRTGRAAGIVASLPESMPEVRAQEIASLGIVPLLGIEEALAAIQAAAKAGEPKPPHRKPLPGLGEGTPRTLDEWAGKRRLAAFGVRVPVGKRVFDGEAAVAAADAQGYPVVLKAVGAALTHKTELGAVRLNLGDAAAVRLAAAAMEGLGEALLVEPMVPDAVAELIVGIDRDPVFGLYLVLGSGGVLAELLADSKVLLLPATPSAIRAALDGLQLAPLLHGYRGRPPADIDAAVEAVLAIQRFAMDHAASLIELDVNPLMLRPAGSGAVAADVLLRLVES